MTLSQKLEEVAHMVPPGEVRTQLDALVSEADTTVKTLTHIISQQQRRIFALNCAVSGICVYCEKPYDVAHQHHLDHGHGPGVTLCTACHLKPRELIAAKLGIE